MITPELLAISLVTAAIVGVIIYLLMSRPGQSNRDLEQLQSQLAVAQQQLTESQIASASLRERLDAREAKIADQTESLQALNQTLDSERVQVIEQREQVSRLATQLEEQKQQTEEKLTLLGEAKVALHDGFKNLANEIFENKQKEFKAQSKEQLNGVLDPLHERIKAFEKRVEESYSQEAKERFSLTKEIRGLQELNTKIAEDAVNLTNALKGENKTQGIWGELVLERVLESSGLEKGREYEIQVSLKQEDGKRYQPDAIVRLPENRDVVVDSKVSLTAYERFCSAGDDTERAKALTAHVQSVRSHIKELAAKDYQNLENIRTLDYVLMFVPIESAFSLATQEDEELYTYALQKHIAIVTPSTLLATLRTIQNMWRIDQQNKNAEQIADRAGKLYDKFVNFVADVETIGSRIESTQSAYDEAYNKLVSGRGNLVKRAEDMKALGAKVSKSLPQNLVDMPQRELPRAVTSVDQP